MSNIIDEAEFKLQKYRVKYYDKQVYICFGMIAFFISKISKKLLTNNLFTKRKTNNTEIRLGFYLWGGLGDALINLNYLYYIKEYLKEENITIDLYFEKEIFNKILSETCIFDNCYIGKNFDLNNYDAFISILTYPKILKFNKELVNNKSEKLFTLLNTYENFNKENYKVLCFEPYLIPLGEKIALSKNKKRIQQADIDEILKIEENFKLPIKIGDIDSTLAKYNLKGKQFITFCRATGANSATHPKMWPIEYYNVLVKLLKEKYPNLILVQIGDANQTYEIINNIDLNLVGKTNFEELKCLLKSSILHVDGEGGLVHLRKAINGNESIVLFGPTSLEFYGYSSNVNIKAENICSIDCQWVSNDWDKLCIKTKSNYNPCLHSILPEFVFKKICNELGNIEVLND